MNQSDKGEIKLIELLTHQSGLTPWIPIYKCVDSSCLREYIDEETIDDYIWETRRIYEFIGMVKRVVELSEREYYIDEKIRILYSIC